MAKPDAQARYGAFISYNRRDIDVAAWIHRRLEAYRIPGSLVGGTASGSTGRGIGKVFLDRKDLSVAQDVGSEVRENLERSDALIVLCSPRSAQSRYVNEEIRHFKSMGRGHRIFAVVLDGEPNAASIPGRDPAQECFPHALLYTIGADGQIADVREQQDPLAADLRDGGDGRETGFLKLVAGLINVGLDDLVRRDRQARHRRVVLLAIASACFAALAVAAGWFAWQASVSRDSEHAAIAQSLVQRGYDLLRQGRVTTAAKYAIAGIQEYPQIESFETLLAWIVAESGDSPVVAQLDSGIRDAAFSHNGQRLALVGADRTASVWDVETRRQVLTLSKGEPVVSIAYGRNWILTARKNGSLSTWDPTNGARIEQLDEVANSDLDLGELSHVKLARDGSTLFLHFEHGSLGLCTDGWRVCWLSSASDLHPSGRMIAILTAEGVRLLDISTVISGTDLESFVDSIDPESDSRLLPFESSEHSEKSTHGCSVMFDEAGDRIAVICDDDEGPTIWDIASGTNIETNIGSTRPDRVTFGPNGLIAYDEDYGGIIIEAPPNTADRREYLLTRAWPTLTPDGRLAVMLDDGAVRISALDSPHLYWREEDGLHWREEKSGSMQLTVPSHQLPHYAQDPRVVSAVRDPGKSRLAVVVRNGGVHIWDTKSRRLIRTIETNHDAEFVALHPSRPLLAVATSWGSIEFWELSTGSRLGERQSPLWRTTRFEYDASGVLHLYRSDEDGDDRYAALDHPALRLSREDLITRACDRLLVPAARSFSAAELAKEPLIREVWLGSRRERNLCPGEIEAK